MIRQLALAVVLAAAAQSAPPGSDCVVCPSIERPVCGSNLKTYSNECAFNCAKSKTPALVILHQGNCPPSPPPPTCLCSQNYKPICGTDGNTYSNECMMSCNMGRVLVEKAHDGPCSAVQVVDAAAAQTQHSGVKVEDAAATIVQVAKNSDPCSCTRSYKPVCGSNGETYNNECLLNCVAATEAMARSAVAKVHDGPCGSAGSPVQVADASAVQVAESPADPCTCTRSYKPVCGTNGETYNNVCLLNCVAATSSSGVALKHVGPCGAHHVADGSRCDCGRELEPVCGSNAVMYSNKCLFECAENKNPGIKIVHPSFCSQPRR